MKNPGNCKATAKRETFNPRDGRDELNMAEFPLAVLGDHVPAGQKTIEFSDEIEDWKTGKTIERRVCITGSDKFGLPTSKDEDVLLALLQLTRMANDFTDPEVPFTKHQVLEILGWQKTGWAYHRIEESLHRWKGVSVHYFNAWRDRGNKAWRDSEASGVIEYVKLVDGRVANGSKNVAAPHEQSRFIWNKHFMESFRAGFLKKLDFEVYRQLRRPAARRAYRFLDKRFWHRSDWEFPLRTFACEKVGFSRAYDTGQLRARLQPALKELEAVGMIEPATFTKQRRGEWRIAVQQKQIAQPLENQSPQCSESEAMLTARSISRRMAKSLAKTFQSDHIARNVQLFDRLVNCRDSRVSKNPPGFLVTAIREDIAGQERSFKPSPPSQTETPPPNRSQFKPVTEPRIDRRRQIDAYWMTLDNDRRRTIEVAAFQSARPLLLEGYERAQACGQDAIVKIYRQSILDQYLAERLAEALPNKSAA